MKILLIGLMILGSFTAFAQDYKCEMNGATRLSVNIRLGGGASQASYFIEYGGGIRDSGSLSLIEEHRGRYIFGTYDSGIKLRFDSEYKTADFSYPKAGLDARASMYCR